VRIYSEIDRIINCIHKNPSEELKSNVYTLARKVLTDEARTNSDSLEEQINKITTNVLS
jgi:phosphoribosylaminoimidazole (AIR) synthetase